MLKSYVCCCPIPIVANTTATCQLKLARKYVIVDVKTIKAVFLNRVFPMFLK